MRVAILAPHGHGTEGRDRLTCIDDVADGRVVLHGGGLVAGLELDVDAWSEQQFGTCDLHDIRRTRRAVKMGIQFAGHPDGTTPTQTETWADLKAAYRLFDQKHVTFQALCTPHWRATRACAPGTWLLIGDTTEVEFGIQRQVAGLGPTGDGDGRGFFLHSSLMIHAETEEVAGLAGAELYHRVPAPPNESASAKKKRDRESEVWGRVVTQVGPPPAGARFVHVFDAGADNYEVYCHLQLQRSDWVVRVAQHHRNVEDCMGRLMPLSDLVRQQPLAGTYRLALRARPGQPSRTANLQVRFAPLTMPVPTFASPFTKQCGIPSIPMFVVEVREVNAPAGVEPLRWVLLTSVEVKTFGQAWEVIGWYEKRPVVEDYHKCLKTGTRVEERQYETSARLERVTGMLSVVAVRLLQMKFVARADPDRPAEQLVPAAWLRMLGAIRKGRHKLDTVGQFFRSLAMLGGFLGRKGDGQPGWLTIWRGFEKLRLCIRGADAVHGNDVGKD